MRAELVGTPPVLGLFVRLAVGQGGAYDLSGKFGVAVEEAGELLRLARPHAARLGLCFHVGSQCLDPAVYARAMALAADAVALSGVAIDVVDVGGGFPVSYPDAVPPPLDDYVAAIGEAAARFGDGISLWAEPGRALVAGGGSVVVQVQLRRGDALYVNDGVYGSLSDAGHPGFRFPARRVPVDGAADSEATLRAFCPVRADLRQRRLHEGAVPAAGGHRRGRLDRAGPARRLWGVPAHPLQRLREHP